MVAGGRTWVAGGGGAGGRGGGGRRRTARRVRRRRRWGRVVGTGGAGDDRPGDEVGDVAEEARTRQHLVGAVAPGGLGGVAVDVGRVGHDPGGGQGGPQRGDGTSVAGEVDDH